MNAFTEEQMEVIKQARVRNVAVRADAGTGKTTTVGGICNDIGYPHMVVYFNKSAANEALTKLPQAARPFTLHSLMYSIASIYFDAKGKKLRADPKKQVNILKTLIPDAEDEVWSDTSRVIGYMGFTCSLPEDMSHLSALEYYDEQMLSEETEGFAPNADIHAALEYQRRSVAMVEKEGIVSFDEMLCMPIWFDIKPEAIRDPRNYRSRLAIPRTLIVDEAQDLSPLNHHLLMMLNPERFHMVGDPNQAIYAWRGASPRSFQTLKNMFDCKELPMTMNFRCSKSVIKYVQENMVDTIRHHPGAPEGVVDFGDLDFGSYGAGDVIICRNNAPLVKLALHLLRTKGRIVYMNRGKEPDAFGSQIKDRWKKLAGVTHADKLRSLDAWYNRRIAKVSNAEARRVDDVYECVKALLTNHSDARVIDTLFGFGLPKGVSAPPQDVVLSTGHRAKGLEWNRVGHYHSELIGAYATDADQIQQEDNLRYVISTRAKKDLRVHEE